MPRALEIFLTLIFVLFIANVAYLAFDPFGQVAVAQDEHRRQSLQAIADAFDTIPATVSASVIPSGPAQIGTDTTDCALQTPFCTIQQNDCVDSARLFPKDTLTVAADIKHGTIQKTGYAISYTDNDTIILTACYSNSGQKIEVTKHNPLNQSP